MNLSINNFAYKIDIHLKKMQRKFYEVQYPKTKIDVPQYSIKLSKSISA